MGDGAVRVSIFGRSKAALVHAGDDRDDGAAGWIIGDGLWNSGFVSRCGHVPRDGDVDAGGTLAEALITTALGIFVAVPTSWSCNYLSERSELMTIEMEVATREVQTYLAKREARSP